MRTHTSREFSEWRVFLDMEDTEGFKAEHWYLAQIAAEVRRGHVEHPNRVRTEQLLLKFQRASPVKVSRDTNTQNSKAFWLAMVTGNQKRKS